MEEALEWSMFSATSAERPESVSCALLEATPTVSITPGECEGFSSLPMESRRGGPLGLRTILEQARTRLLVTDRSCPGELSPEHLAAEQLREMHKDTASVMPVPWLPVRENLT